MRTIKFRVWDKVKKAFLKQGNFCLFPEDNNTLDTRTIEPYGELGDVKGVVQQFTGILDKNGVEIYEGDILTEECNLDKDCCYDDTTTYMRNSVVYFKDGVFSHDEENPFYLSLNISEGKNNFVEVIGNIFENPELLDD